ncbi:MAG: MgtC/SapB family protein [Planctomycetota bacterium]|jgi:putative Mg2+ transporter-C (MgtC) family protein
MNVTDIDMVWRLALAALCGGLIGLERETHSQPAGLRTHMVVAVGAALVMIVSLQVAARSVGGGVQMADPGRIAAQVVSGMGFLGAGAIIRFGFSVRGLTTAATLWTAAAIGLASGLGYWRGATFATLLVLVTVFLLDRLEKKLFVGKSRRHVVVTAKDIPGLLGRAEKILEGCGLVIKEMGFKKDFSEQKVSINFLADTPERTDMEKLTREVSALEGVEGIDID